MKKAQLLEWGIITVGVIFGYKFFEATFSMIVQFAFAVSNGADDISRILLPSFLMIIFYFILFMFLIRRSEQIANYLSNNTAGENVPVRIGKRSLLQVILIGICMATIVSNLADILLYIVDAFTNEVGRRNMNEDFDPISPKRAFKVKAVQAIIAGVILFFSKDISHWFVKKNEVDELVFDSNPEKE
ncbi:MAG TPA: hypothetical protein VGO58_20310 [Chitinophagaceae bacterium]|jgi:di/tricarboxylate transporter|nr:hypothetical protein [Chitinophagaceae bacterium]